MFIPITSIAFNFLHLKSLLNTYIDIQLSRQQMISTIEEHTTPCLMTTIPLQQWVDVPVTLANKSGVDYAKVSEPDVQKVISLGTTWRRASSGYAILVENQNGKFITHYMHKIVFGGPAHHLNGDRLDNRRENLCSTTRKRKQKDFELHTLRMGPDEINTYNSTDPILPCVSGFVRVEYANGKTYIGEVENGIPHGYGSMFKKNPPYETNGMWVNGQIKEGMVTHFKQLPVCMCPDLHICPFRDVQRVELVSKGYKL